MKFYRWSQTSSLDQSKILLNWYLHIELVNCDEWDLKSGHYIESWSPNSAAVYDGEGQITDFPFTSDMLPVYSPRLKALMENLGVEGIQYLPLPVRHQSTGTEVLGYHLANYLHVIDCLDRERCIYQVWTKDTLLFGEKRPQMFGTFRDVQKPVLDPNKIGDNRLFRLWGWKVMVVVREDVKEAIEKAGMTGGWFTELDGR